MMHTTGKSKTLAAWSALLGGAFGAHRFYVNGLGDKLAWLHALPTLAGLYGLQRMQSLGQDDRLAWLLLPLLGLMLFQGAACAVYFGLSPDERWGTRPTRWGPIIAVVLGVAIGGITLMSTIAFSAQRYFESQAES